MRYRDPRMPVARLKSLVNRFAVAGHGNRAVVGALRCRARDFSNAPRNAIIQGHDDSLIAIHVAYRVRGSSARIVRHINGTIRRECLDRTLFWTVTDLESKLLDFKDYFNRHRTHTGVVGRTPEHSAAAVLNFTSYRWRQHCRGLYQTPTAA